MEHIHPFEEIDMTAWKRSRHFLLYKDCPFPYVGATAPVDVGQFIQCCADNGIRSSFAFMHIAMTAAQRVENFRYRLRNGSPVLFESVDPSFTVFDGEDELFYFATARTTSAFEDFRHEAAKAEAEALATRCLRNGRQDVVYITCVPWVAFTDILQPVFLDIGDCVPRIAWGKFTGTGGHLEMPVNVLAHHGFVDGVHIAKLFDGIKQGLSDFVAADGKRP